MALKKLVALFVPIMVKEKMGEKSRGVWEELGRALVPKGKPHF